MSKEVEQYIASRFRCRVCGSTKVKIKKLAMTGASFFDRWMNWQRHRYYFASCENCGYTEIYDAEVLEGRKGRISEIMDLLFGG